MEFADVVPVLAGAITGVAVTLAVAAVTYFAARIIERYAPDTDE